MGWVSYVVKRTLSGEDLGEMALIFPKLSYQIEFDTDTYYTMVDLVNIQDFPVECTLLCRNEVDTNAAKSMGFRNATNVSEFTGERWTLNNGSYVELNATGENITLRCYNVKNELMSFGQTDVHPQTSTSSAHVSFLPGLYGTDSECSFAFFRFYGTGVHANTVKFLENLNPYYIQTLNFFANAEPLYSTNDPYGDGGISGGGGGTGTFADEGTNVDIPALPTLSAVSAGFISLFKPTLAELQNLASYMWSDLFDVNGWKKIFADPMDAILGLSIVPVNVPASNAKTVKVGNVSTDIIMPVADSQYIELDCGTLDIKEFWGAYLDYDPYTKAELYLPYIGIHPISVDDIMNKSIRIVYHIDILSGACCAYVQCAGTVLYSFIGQCTSSIPITANNWTNVINGVLSIAGSVGTMVASGGASAPMSIGQIASTAVNTMKPSVEKSGAMSGTGGLMGVQTPYLILTRPRQALPGDQNKFIGYPSFITKKLSDLTGYTEIESIHIENVPATESELTEIENLLNGGVIF